MHQIYIISILITFFIDDFRRDIVIETNSHNETNP